jgi:hypothetical protein
VRHVYSLVSAWQLSAPPPAAAVAVAGGAAPCEQPLSCSHLHYL